MRRILSVAIIVISLLSFFAAAPAYGSENNITFHFAIDDISTMKDSNVVLSLSFENEQAPFSSKSYWITKSTHSFDLTFTPPEYEIGQIFTLSVESGGNELSYNGTRGKKINVQPYIYTDEGGAGAVQRDFYIGLTPLWNKEAAIRVKGNPQTFYAHCYVGEDLYITTDLLDALKINYKYEKDCESPNILLYSDDGATTAQYYINNIYSLKNGTAYNAKHKTFTIDDMPYVPLYDVAVHFACSYTVTDGNIYNPHISLLPTPYRTKKDIENLVNGKNISSKTDYMIWVNKSAYTVNVFSGARGNWSFVTSFPCAIGAPSSPTVEGSFEYYQLQSRWSYDNFYCGPVMRFHNGYALHSTLLKYSGGFYDNRVGAKISHGCVRIRPEGINWLAENIPLHTRIWVTE